MAAMPKVKNPIIINMPDKNSFFVEMIWWFVLKGWSIYFHLKYAAIKLPKPKLSINSKLG